MEQVSFVRLRAELGNYLDRSHYQGETFLVTRHNTPIVLLSPAPSEQDIEAGTFETTSAAEARKNLSEHLSRVHFQAVNLLVQKHRKTIALFRKFDNQGQGC